MRRHACVRGISQDAFQKERVKNKRGLQGAVLFVVISLGIYLKIKEHLIVVKNVENCLCVVPCLKIYHTERISKNMDN